MSDCLFCKMVSGEIPVPKVFEDDSVIVIRDINPQAPYHFLAIPRAHFSAIHEVPADDPTLFEKLFSAVRTVIENEGLPEKGYRLVINSGSSAGQSVDHIHVHILSGRQLEWPPG